VKKWRNRMMSLNETKVSEKQKSVVEWREAGELAYESRLTRLVCDE
jgi:hypothetical protein